MSRPPRSSAPSLLSMQSFPRFRKDHWETFEDIVTPEQSYKFTWCESSLEHGGGAFTESFGADCPPIDKALGKEDVQAQLHAHETRLWAYPHSIAPLIVGHVLLDLCPAEQCLERAVHLHCSDSDTPLYTVYVGGAYSFTSPKVPSQWAARSVLLAMEAFIEAEGLWDTTGCFHRAGVYAIEEGALIQRAEDIGRHNCIDRLAGWSVMEGIPLSDKALLISARMTSSLCAKAIRAGFSVIVSRSAVTTAAIAMAQKAGVTLIGFARTQEQRFTVFHQGDCTIHHA